MSAPSRFYGLALLSVIVALAGCATPVRYNQGESRAIQHPALGYLLAAALIGGEAGTKVLDTSTATTSIATASSLSMVDSTSASASRV